MLSFCKVTFSFDKSERLALPCFDRSPLASSTKVAEIDVEMTYFSMWRFLEMYISLDVLPLKQQIPAAKKWP